MERGVRVRPFSERLRSTLARVFLQPFLPVDRSRVRRRLIAGACVAIGLLVLWSAALAWVRLFASEPDVPPARWLVPRPARPAGLAVFVHGWKSGPDDLEPLARYVRDIEQYAGYDTYLWSFDASMLSNANPSALAGQLAFDIDELVPEEGTPLLLVGHSLGGLLVRRAYLDGLERGHGWTDRVDRILLMAAPNRGTRAVSRSRFLWLFDAFMRSLGVGELIQATYRGAPFIVDLRIDWIRVFQSLEEPPIVAQIVGRNDAIVSPSDSVDVLQFPRSVMRQAAQSTHASVVRPEESGPYVREVLTELPPPRPDVEAPDVFKLLVVHGIRDYGDRFDRLKAEVDSLATLRGREPRTAAPRYTYFSALQFVNPFSRRNKVYDFADLYTELLARPPVDAPIHFAGHSFGTYLMGRSVMDYRSIRFDRVYLAGSVLHEGFLLENDSLGKRILPGKIRHVRNDIAAEDWPVGILCAGLARLGLADGLIGAGGFHGFSGVVDADRLSETRYFDGGHGKALEGANLPTIAQWVLDSGGEEDSYDHDMVESMLRAAEATVDDRGGLWNFLSRISPALFVLALLLAGYMLVVGRRPGVAAAEILFVFWLLNVI